MKKLLFCFLFIVSFNEVFSTHIIGGEMRYEYIGPGSLPNSKLYRLRLLLLRDGTSGAQFIPQYVVGVFNNDNGQKVPGTAANNNWLAVEDFPGANPVPILVSPCISNAPILDYTYKRYSFNIELPDNTTGYTVAFQTFSRQNSNNVNANQGATYSCVIPGLSVLPNPLTDSSPEYKLPVSVICENSPFSLDFSAIDPNGDSIVYSFCDAFDGGAATLADFQNPAPPPYNSVIYTPPYNSGRPLGPLATINPNTGIISGTAPGGGKYVVCVCASVFRNGVLISVHRKDLIVAVSGCIPLTAQSNFTPITCDGFTVTFNNGSTGNPTDYFWDFGDPSTGAANTSILASPTHTFSDTGVFYVKLKVSILGQCEDSITKPIRVYPGFLPGFLTSPALCANTPIQFTDTTYSRYGAVDTWRWDFGDLTTLADTSHLQNPVYTYPAAGTYNVELQVSNDKGCAKTYNKTITITDNPIVDIFPADTTYCGLDSLQLTGVGTGNFVWTPNINIIGANTATPIVFPTVPVKYYATLTDAFGCKSKDSITVTPKNDLTNSITVNPPNICAEDTLQLSGTSNYLSNVSWQWSPAASVEFPTQQNTRAFPLVNTTYTLVTTWGKHCVATATKPVTVKPLAIPNAGPDQTICGGQQTATLNASGGNTYTWSPPTGLSNTNTANPVAAPTVTTTYAVAVGVTGCAKTKTDSITVFVSAPPPLAMLNDTLICNIDTLQLTTGGTGNFLWSPNYMISSVTAQSPLVSPDVPTMYYVRLTDPFGCFNTDSVFVDVKDHVTLFAGNDTTICQTDGFRLTTVSDALHYKWTPNTYLDNDTAKRPFTIPLTTITYRVVANIGKCQSQDDVTITAVPYPAPNAGPDQAICPEWGSNVQLNASGGSSFLWTPSTFLNNRNLPNPVAIRPTASIRYIVAVTDTLGCPKPVRDTVWVIVHPRVIADAGPADTIVVLGQPLLLHATGGISYLWSPTTWLNSDIIQSPLAFPQGNIRYTVTATSVNGCTASDFIDVTVYRIDPDMYVPNVFTPNGDGKNDIFRPILIGMKELHYFRVYNRFGQMVYSTTEIGKGWDGIYLGKGQDPATFVWYAEAVTYKGDVRFKKGSVVLVRQ